MNSHAPKTAEAWLKTLCENDSRAEETFHMLPQEERARIILAFAEVQNDRKLIN
jgi:hypothetical protein